MIPRKAGKGRTDREIDRKTQICGMVFIVCGNCLKVLLITFLRQVSVIITAGIIIIRLKAAI